MGFSHCGFPPTCHTSDMQSQACELLRTGYEVRVTTYGVRRVGELSLQGSHNTQAIMQKAYSSQTCGLGLVNCGLCEHRGTVCAGFLQLTTHKVCIPQQPGSGMCLSPL